jgi:hypothetical protein
MNDETSQLSDYFDEFNQFFSSFAGSATQSAKTIADVKAAVSTPANAGTEGTAQSSTPPWVGYLVVGGGFVGLALLVVMASRKAGVKG